MDKDEESALLMNVVSFVLTEFGRFGSIVDNPTTIFVSPLESYIRRNTFCQWQNKVSKMIQPVSFDNHVQNQLHPSWLNDNDVIVVLHLGVDYKSMNIKLKQCGINDV